ncbi:ABC transporter ATP-binding protein [Rubrimonas cliftonensis]|uniref:Putative spermidine/putrescine transport system ATP-binding protein n=1 Tax=Rubrimonas cliftonensis TaxID=89524 RepID=A0A1H3WV28_9RHOB|nr:ABC transporter ATP-binding protein [Rubrimonas cliftonensis]SDZ90989.1 putative spermidine/putrescine transport system ATP-binding protein [Rubrimonas cliftonensis]
MKPTSAAPSVAPAVEAEGVSRRYGDVAALAEASFRLEAGRFLTVLGPSGSGKSTLLRLIAGFEAPDAGRLRLYGRPVEAIPPHRRSVGMVFQRLALFPHMTAAENVAFPLRMRRWDARDIPARVARFLSLVRLDGLGARRPHELSGGQQQRVAIARALVFEPELLLLDEPLAALDAKLREEMQLEFRRIQRELGVTTINVTHDQREALVMSDRVIVMDQGRILQDADPETLWREPAHAFVAGFLGVGAFLDGVAAEGPALAIAGATLPGRAPAGRAAPAPGARARGSLRADRVRLAGAGATPAGCHAAAPALVEDAIFEGDRILYELRLPTMGGARLRAIDRDPGAHARHAPGAAVTAGWARDDMILFDAD